MKQLFIYSFVFSLFLTSSCTEKKEENSMDEQIELQSIKNDYVVFYNVQNLFDINDDPLTNDNSFTPEGEMTWNQERYSLKIKQLSDIVFEIGNKNPLLIGLVEIENEEVVQAIANEGNLKNSKYRVAHFDSEDVRGIDCALLYDAEKIRKIHQEKLSVELAGDADFVTRDILYFKGETSEKKLLHIFVNHWSSRRDGKAQTEIKRIASAQTLRKKIEEIMEVEPLANILIMGDFNDQPSDKSLQVLQQIGGKNTPFFSNLMRPLQKRKSGTIVYKRQWFLFDQFIVSESLLSPDGLHIKNKEAFIYKTKDLLFTYPNGSSKPNATYGGSTYFGGYSDHLPIYLTITQ
ncbi:MAG: endonuclease [Bacteroidetes bacterium]|nr:endonuclease [Bacteroidota bacterium]